MQIKYSKVGFFAFFAILVLILYQSLSNHIFGLMGGGYWKQILPLILFMALLLSWMVKVGRIYINPFSYTLFLFSISIFYFLYGLIFSMNKMEGMVWVVYRFIGYLWFFVPVVIFLNIQHIQNNFFRIVFLTCFSVALGVIVDAVYDGWDYLKTVEVSMESTKSISIIDKRSDFFTGSSSNLFVVLSLPLALALSEKGSKATISMLIYCLVSVVSIYLSGSRFSLILMLLIIGLSFFFSSKKRGVKLVFAVFIFLLSLLCFFYFYDIFRDMRMFQVLDPEDPGNRGRLMYYLWFYENYFDFPPINSIFGYGPGYLSGAENVFPSVHFESSAITMLIETGLVGFFVFYVLFFTILIISFKSGFLRVWVCLIALFTMFVPAFLSYQIMFCLGVAFFWDRGLLGDSDFKIKSAQRL